MSSIWGVNGTGIAELDDSMSGDKIGLNAVRSKARSGSDDDGERDERRMNTLFMRILAEASRRKAELGEDRWRDAGAAPEPAICDLAQGEAVLPEGAPLPDLEEMRWIEEVDVETRRIFLCDGSILVVKQRRNRDAFLSLVDCENELRDAASFLERCQSCTER